MARAVQRGGELKSCKVEKSQNHYGVAEFRPPSLRKCFVEEYVLGGELREPALNDKHVGIKIWLETNIFLALPHSAYYDREPDDRIDKGNSVP